MHTRGATLGRPRRLLVVAMLSTLVLSGCGGSEDSGLAEATGEVTASSTPMPTPSPTPSPTVSATPSDDAPANPLGWRAPAADDRPDQEGSDLYLGRFPERVTGPEQLAAAEAFLRFWRVRLELGEKAELDPAAIGEVATGEAAQNTIALIEGIQRRNGSIQGDVVMHIEGVQLQDTRATVRACMENLTTDRDADGEPTETLTPFYTMSADLVRQGEAWRMTTFRASTGVC